MITVLIATFNGQRTLPITLEALAGLQSPAGGWRLVIVDNGSTDATAAVIASLRSRLPLTCLTEPQRGKNSALNRGLEQISGDLVVFTDDDVIPDPEWLVRIRECADAHPEYDVFGGAIVPHWPYQPPDWLLASVPLGPVFGATDPAWAPGEVSPHFVWGANMAIRKHVFSSGARFDPRFGPDGSADYITGSETQLIHRLAQLGHRCWYSPSIRVSHIVREEQFAMGSILHRAYRGGRLAARLQDRDELLASWRLFGVPLGLWQTLASQSLKTALTALAPRSPRGLRARWTRAEATGRIVETLRVLRELNP